MTTLQAIYKKIKQVPISRLEEVNQFLNLLIRKPDHADAAKESIMSYKDAFADMGNDDYQDFLDNMSRNREKLFNRNDDF